MLKISKLNSILLIISLNSCYSGVFPKFITPALFPKVSIIELNKSETIVSLDSSNFSFAINILPSGHLLRPPSKEWLSIYQCNYVDITFIEPQKTLNKEELEDKKNAGLAYYNNIQKVLPDNFKPETLFIVLKDDSILEFSLPNYNNKKSYYSSEHSECLTNVEKKQIKYTVVSILDKNNNKILVKSNEYQLDKPIIN